MTTTSKLFYLASALSNVGPARKLIEELAARGWTCTYDWTAQWEKEVTGPVETVGSIEDKREILNAELNGVLEADVMILFLPGGRGAHVEFGSALVSAIPVLIVYCGGEEALKGQYNYDCIFYLHESCRKLSCGKPDAGLVAWHLDDMMAEYDRQLADSLG